MIFDFNDHLSEPLIFLALLDECHAECLDGLVLALDLIPQLDYLLFLLMYLRVLAVDDRLPLQLHISQLVVLLASLT